MRFPIVATAVMAALPSLSMADGATGLLRSKPGSGEIVLQVTGFQPSDELKGALDANEGGIKTKDYITNGATDVTAMRWELPMTNPETLFDGVVDELLIPILDTYGITITPTETTVLLGANRTETISMDCTWDKKNNLVQFSFTNQLPIVDGQSTYKVMGEALQRCSSKFTLPGDLSGAKTQYNSEDQQGFLGIYGFADEDAPKTEKSDDAQECWGVGSLLSGSDTWNGESGQEKCREHKVTLQEI